MTAAAETHVINDDVSVYVYPDGSVLFSQRHEGNVSLGPSEVCKVAAILVDLGLRGEGLDPQALAEEGRRVAEQARGYRRQEDCPCGDGTRPGHPLTWCGQGRVACCERHLDRDAADRDALSRTGDRSDHGPWVVVHLVGPTARWSKCGMFFREYERIAPLTGSPSDVTCLLCRDGA